ncbi:ABC transporter permease [Myxococcota bacterium]|nr:ABC transporter permease [Myxococcota bacterium]
MRMPGVLGEVRGPLAWAGAVTVLALVAIAVLAPFIAPYGIQECRLEDKLAPPSPEHWFGADPRGCDVLSRVLLGTRISLVVGVSVVSVSLVVGFVVGSVAGYLGGAIDRTFQFVSDCFQAFPGILLAIALMALARQGSVALVIAALCVSGWVGYARLVRAQVLGLRDVDYIVAARAMGAGVPRILTRHVLPNILSPLIVEATFGMAAAILAEASLSFLGLGVPPDVPSWGAMLNSGRKYLLDHPGFAIWPGLAIMLTVLGFNFLGDGLRDALDPRRAAR